MWLQDLLQGTHLYGMPHGTELRDETHSCIVIWHQMRQLVRASLNVCGIAMEDASARTN